MSTNITARSLVGMSESAKKRLREAIFCGAQVPSFAIGAVSITAALRIGERLRPCPGCWHCRTTWQESSIYQDTAVMHRDGCSHDDPSGFCCFGETTSVMMECDGSGVLPARKKP